MELTRILQQIMPANEEARQACTVRFGHIAKPAGSLGKLETLTARIAAASGSPDINIRKKCVLVFCADNGVVAQGVAQSTQEVTAAIARSLAAGTASVDRMAQSCGAHVYPVDMGMAQPVLGLADHRFGAGTADITLGPAMSRETAVLAILTGISLVRQKKEEGYRLLATGEAGIGNTTTSSAIASVLLNRPVAEVTGRGSGLSDAGLHRKQQVIRTAIETNAPDSADIPDVLAKLGGFDIAGMVGAFLGGAYCHIPVVIDGFISAVAALCAVRLHPAVKEYLLPSHVSAEPAGGMLMEALGFSPVIHGDLRLGEGTGAVALFPLLDMAVNVYQKAATFNDIRVEEYQPWAN